MSHGCCVGMVLVEVCRMYVQAVTRTRGSPLQHLRGVQKFRNDFFKRRRRNLAVANRRTNRYTTMGEGVQHSGYIDIKQPPKVKGRKLKSWKKKWVVLTEMAIRSEGDRSAAKVDVYADEKTATTSPSDKHTFILEFVTDIRAAKSKTKNHAFEIVENEAVLLLSGTTELETQTWIAAFKKIFFPGQYDNDTFTVEIHTNEHSHRLSLHGTYELTVNPEVIAIRSEEFNSYEWSLNMLKRFHVDTVPERPGSETLVIECGPKSECGEAKFMFSSDDVWTILESIKKNIFLAISFKKKEEKSKSNTPSVQEKQSRSSLVSNTSDGSAKSHRVRSETCSSSEQRYRDLLESPSTVDLNSASVSPNVSPHVVTRMTSQVSSESHESDNAVSDTPPEIPKKKRHSVTFDTGPLTEPTPRTDVLSTPIEIYDSDSADYNKVEFNNPITKPPGQIISTFTVAKPGYTTKVLLDDHGYSHVDFNSGLKPMVQDPDKDRSLSNISSQSSMSCRSGSVGSRDSGFLHSILDKSESDTKQRVASRRSTQSFDSAVSTSSTVEQADTTTMSSVTTTSQITVEVQEIEVTVNEYVSMANADKDTEEIDEASDTIYQDMSMAEDKDTTISATEPTSDKVGLKKSNSTGNFKSANVVENEYEDLNSYRKGKKNLVKHLGMDPQINPSSVPPALPERPSSYKLRRKSYNPQKKLFTLPFRNKKKLRERAASISSSSSGSENGAAKSGKKKADISVKIWPLGNKSVMADNDDLYQPISIQRFLKDNDGTVGSQKRERSCSLNLNTANLIMKRPSIQSVKDFDKVDRKNAMWKHNRNVSMEMDLLNRKNDPEALAVTGATGKELSVTFHPCLDSVNKDNDTNMVSDEDHSKNSIELNYDDEEPIYAELEPTRKLDTDTSDCDNPFPNITIWRPDDISDVTEVSELNGTVYENEDESFSNLKQTGDVLNQGFVLNDYSKDVQNKSVDNGITPPTVDNILIDLSDANDNTDKGLPATMDIFNLGFGPNYASATPITPVNGTSPVTNGNLPTSMADIFELANPTPPVSNTSCSSTNILDSVNTVDIVSGIETSNVTMETPSSQECIYMDMSECKNESIYVLPSSLKHDGD